MKLSRLQILEYAKEGVMMRIGSHAAPLEYEEEIDELEKHLEEIEKRIERAEEKL